MLKSLVATSDIRECLAVVPAVWKGPDTKADTAFYLAREDSLDPFPPFFFEDSNCSIQTADDSNPVHCLGERPTGQSIHVQDWNKTYLRQRNQIVLHHLERFTHNNTCVAEKTTLVLGLHPSIHHRPIVCAIGSKLFHCTPFVRYEPQQVSTHPVHGCQILQR